MEYGCIDWHIQKREDTAASLEAPVLREKLETFIDKLVDNGLKTNTIYGYKRIVSYFLIYCQSKGYQDLSELKANDITIA